VANLKDRSPTADGPPGHASARGPTIASVVHNRLRGLALTTALAAAVTCGVGTAAPGAVPESGPAGTADDRFPASSETPLLVRFRADADAGDRRFVRRSAGVEHESSLPLPGLQVVEPEPGVSLDEATARLEGSARVLYAEPDALRTSAAALDDSYFGSQWGLHNTGQRVYGRTGVPDADIDAPEAWDLTTGSRAVASA